MHNYVSLSVLVFLLIVGCGADKPKFTEEQLAKMPLAQRDGLPEASGGFVLAVGDETITADQIVSPMMEHFRPIAQRSNFEQFKEQAKPELERILTAKISNILLYQRAKKDAGADIEQRLEKLAKAEVRKFAVSFEGDYAKAEEELKRRGMNWASFEEYKKREILSYSYIHEKLSEEKPITHGELLDYYNEMKEELFARPAMIKFQLIDIEAEELEVTDPNQSQQEKAKSLANELLGRIQAGEDFSGLAQVYPGVSFVGFNRPVQPENLEKPYDILAAEAEKIEPGQVAAPIEAGTHIFIMKLEEKRPKSFEPFEKVQKEIETRIMFDRRKKVVEEFNKKLAEQAELGERDEFTDFCLKQIYRMSVRTP